MESGGESGGGGGRAASAAIEVSSGPTYYAVLSSTCRQDTSNTVNRSSFSSLVVTSAMRVFWFLIVLAYSMNSLICLDLKIVARGVNFKFTFSSLILKRSRSYPRSIVIFRSRNMSMPIIILYLSPSCRANCTGISRAAVLCWPRMMVVSSLAVCQTGPLTPPTRKSEATKLQKRAHPVVMSESWAPVSTRAHYGVVHLGKRMGTYRVGLTLLAGLSVWTGLISRELMSGGGLAGLLGGSSAVVESSISKTST